MWQGAGRPSPAHGPDAVLGGLCVPHARPPGGERCVIAQGVTGTWAGLGGRSCGGSCFPCTPPCVLALWARLPEQGSGLHVADVPSGGLIWGAPWMLEEGSNWRRLEMRVPRGLIWAIQPSLATSTHLDPSDLRSNHREHPGSRGGLRLRRCRTGGGWQAGL